MVTVREVLIPDSEFRCFLRLEEVHDRMLAALRRALPILTEAVAAGLLPQDDLSDRLALDAVEEAIAAAEALSVPDA